MSRNRQEGAGENGFLARWSRRKQQVRDGRDPLDEAAADGVTAPGGVEVAPKGTPAGGEVDESDLSDTELLAKYDLPDPAALTASDDVAAFMRSGVPSRLRNLALRRLWRLDPVLANLDGLNDYDGDYTDAAYVVANLKTLYQVGRGGAAHLEDAARKLADAGGPEAPAPDVDLGPAAEQPVAVSGDTHAEVNAPELDPGRQEAPGVAPGERSETAGDDRRVAESPPSAPRRRRMVFTATDGADGSADSRLVNK